ncbi:MAG: UDP-2,3-diacylglucosamine diphosphatase LpxI [Nitrospina sp.]|jgi:UDP-2,3-diacylglucosamine hydrolase|nr:UDP-2,3-diacylglucosamine diphosphatase LpxI [Nitrospina sp.]MBT6601782.1 UDP-2,3-diacylglucosamine diphosphatase LpxI [Nitrospina sp.]
MSDSEKKIGLLAGAGEVPAHFAKQACRRGIRIVAVSFSDEIHTKLEPLVEKAYSIGIGKPGKIFKTFKDEKITDLLMLGKVDKEIIFRPSFFDLRAIKFFKSLISQEDKSLLLGVIKEIEKEGFNVLDQKELLGEIFPGKGVLTERKPSIEEMENIKFGIPIAKKLADMEIGQTIVVKNKTVVSVEAIEGTDKAIERGCELSRGKCVAIKVSRTNQDYRYDVPGIGLLTMEKLINGRASVLAIEAGRVMIVDQEKVVEIADRAKISLVCI